MRFLSPANASNSGRRAPARSGRKAAPRRRTAMQPPRWLKPVLKAAAVLGMVGGLGGGMIHLYETGLVEDGLLAAKGRMLDATAIAGLRVTDVLVEGRVRSDSEMLLAALKVERGMPMLAFDPVEAKQRLEAINWVRSATIERRLPNTIFVSIEERRPMALWQRENKLVLVDFDGEIVLHNEVAPFGKLPVLVGDTAPAQAPALLAMLEREPALKTRVRAASWVGERRWTLHMDNGIDVNLPEENPADAWLRLATLERDQKVLAKDVVAIDLRFADRLVVRVAPDALKRATQPAKGAPGKNT